MTDLPLCGQGTHLVLWIGVAITCAIFATMVYSIVRFCNAPATTHRFAHRVHVEVIWAAIPILILIATAAPAVKPLITIEQNCVAITAALAR